MQKSTWKKKHSNRQKCHKTLYRLNNKPQLKIIHAFCTFSHFYIVFFSFVFLIQWQGFNIHINGCFHCCLRYKQIHCLHEQLKRCLPGLVLPPFPSKKFLPLTQNQLEQRRSHLERYIQLVGQDPVFSKCELLRIFLLNAQQESAHIQSHEVTIDVYLMNGYRIPVSCYTTDCTSKVLEKAARNIDLTPQFVEYFTLYLMRTDPNGDTTLVRRLMDFEAPYITNRVLDDCQIVIRKR